MIIFGIGGNEESVYERLCPISCAQVNNLSFEIQKKYQNKEI